MEILSHIYALVLSDDPTVYHYVGKTEKTLARRLADHLRNCHRFHTHKDKWLRICLAASRQVIIVELEKCAGDRNALDEREMFWIAKVKAEGHPLKNLTDGGEGGVPCDEVREKIRQQKLGKPRPPHVIEALRRNGLRYVGAANPNYGKHHSEAARRAISEAHKGKPLSDGHRAKLSVSGKGKNAGERNGRGRLTQTQVDEMRTRRAAGESIPSLAINYGVHYQHAYRIIHHLRWA
jgi:hypothetical protein